MAERKRKSERVLSECERKCERNLQYLKRYHKSGVSQQLHNVNIKMTNWIKR